MKIKEVYEQMRKNEGSLVYINPLFNPKTDEREAYIVKSEARTFTVIQVFDTPNTEAVEPIFTYADER